MNKISRNEFPRPDFIREDWVSLNGQWDFSFDTDSFDKKINVPFCYQSKLSGINDSTDHDIVWYKRSFQVDSKKLDTKGLILNFGAVDYKAEIWINDKFVGSHEGGHISFSFDITEFVNAGENVLKLKVEDYKNADKPRGKQSWIGKKFGCWYTPTTGIWQNVWLEYSGKNYVKRVKITPDVSNLSAKLELFLSTQKETSAKITVRMDIEGVETILSKQEIYCKHGYGSTGLTFPDYDLRREFILWTPENPTLIEVDVELENQSDSDFVSTYFGLRSISSLNGVLMLNNVPYYQSLILDQGYWEDSLLTPPSDEAIKKDIELTKEMGFNGARKHQKIEDPRYYYWADKLGLLVWGEMPSAYEYNDTAIKNTIREMTEFVERDYNHPCIVMWVPLNESWGVRNIQIDKQQQDYARALIYLLKSLDKTRLVSSNDGWEQVTESDICAIHDYTMVPDTMDKYDDMEMILDTTPDSRMIFAENNEYDGQPILMTEYGGIAFLEENESGWGYGNKVAGQKEFIERLLPITEYMVKNRNFAGYCYTQLTDVMQEVNGLLYIDRTYKIPPEELRKIFGLRR